MPYAIGKGMGLPTPEWLKPPWQGSYQTIKESIKQVWDMAHEL